jgi:hypothetical protein
LSSNRAKRKSLEAQASRTQTLAEVIAYYTKDTTVLSRRDVPQETGKRGCTHLEEITSKEPAIPPADSLIRVPIIINTDFFCEIHGHKIVTLVRNHYGDKHQEEYQQVALRMAKSIRLLQQEDVR